MENKNITSLVNKLLTKEIQNKYDLLNIMVKINYDEINDSIIFISSIFSNYILTEDKKQELLSIFDQNKGFYDSLTLYYPIFMEFFKTIRIDDLKSNLNKYKEELLSSSLDDLNLINSNLLVFNHMKYSDYILYLNNYLESAQIKYFKTESKDEYGSNTTLYSIDFIKNHTPLKININENGNINANLYAYKKEGYTKKGEESFNSFIDETGLFENIKELENNKLSLSIDLDYSGVFFFLEYFFMLVVDEKNDILYNYLDF